MNHLRLTGGLPEFQLRPAGCDQYTNEETTMDRQVLDETIHYVRKELTRIHEDLTWADGAQAQSLETRKSRLAAELDRLESMRCIAPWQNAGVPMR
jgi:hypothetical protein